jgi:hypothetical protein
MIHSLNRLLMTVAMVTLAGGALAADPFPNRPIKIGGQYGPRWPD